MFLSQLHGSHKHFSAPLAAFPEPKQVKVNKRVLVFCPSCPCLDKERAASTSGRFWEISQLTVWTNKSSQSRYQVALSKRICKSQSSVLFGSQDRRLLGLPSEWFSKAGKEHHDHKSSPREKVMGSATRPNVLLVSFNSKASFKAPQTDSLEPLQQWEPLILAIHVELPWKTWTQ